MRRIGFLLGAVVALAGVVSYIAPTSGQADEEAAPIFGITIPAGYRDWRLISVAHEEGNLNDLRAILGNDVAIKAYREGNRPFPDGTIIARDPRAVTTAAPLRHQAGGAGSRRSQSPQDDDTTRSIRHHLRHHSPHYCGRHRVPRGTLEPHGMLPPPSARRLAGYRVLSSSCPHPP
jgi:hypothetical protein